MNDFTIKMVDHDMKQICLQEGPAKKPVKDGGSNGKGSDDDDDDKKKLQVRYTVHIV